MYYHRRPVGHLATLRLRNRLRQQQAFGPRMAPETGFVEYLVEYGPAVIDFLGGLLDDEPAPGAPTDPYVAMQLAELERLRAELRAKEGYVAPWYLAAAAAGGFLLARVL